MRSLMMITLAAAGAALFAGGARAQDHALVERLAERVVHKYAYATCAELADEHRHKPIGEHADIEEHAIREINNDPQMRREFIDRVAVPLANRMFECGFIP
jgi:adenosyl cobinamide kinase/adenosyl cobinamide phosphate guanylyltransferase